MPQQIAVRLSDELVAQLDALVRDGAYQSRAAAVRAGIEALTAYERRCSVDHALLDGYRRLPPGPTDDAAALASLRDAIAEEPW